MPSEDREKRIEIYKKVAEFLGFKSWKEFTENAGISLSTMGRIFQGKTKLTPDKSHKMIESIKNQNFCRGWDGRQSADMLADAMFYAIPHFEQFNKARYGFMVENIEKGYKKYIIALKERSKESAKGANGSCSFSDLLGVSKNTIDQLKSILIWIKYENMKYDFGNFNQREKIFSQEKEVIYYHIEEGMKQGFYTEVKDLFTEIRHIAHLCCDFQFVTNASQWLIKHSFDRGDMCTYTKAKATLAWTLTSHQEVKKLEKAQSVVSQAWKLIENIEISNQIDSSNLDVIAIICELRLRIPLRLKMYGGQTIISNDFDLLFRQSQLMLRNFKDLCLSKPRLEKRYQIPLHYQKGIYCYLQGEYEEAKKEFDSVIYDANLIGWERVEHGGYTWLATIAEEIGDIEDCLKHLKYLEWNAQKLRSKRQELCDAMRRRNQR